MGVLSSLIMGCKPSGTSLLNCTTSHFTARSKTVVGPVRVFLAVGTDRMRSTRTRGEGGKGRGRDRRRDSQIRVWGEVGLDTTTNECGLIMNVISQEMRSECGSAGQGGDGMLKRTKVAAHCVQDKHADDVIVAERTHCENPMCVRFDVSKSLFKWFVVIKFNF